MNATTPDPSTSPSAHSDERDTPDADTATVDVAGADTTDVEPTTPATPDPGPQRGLLARVPVSLPVALTLLVTGVLGLIASATLTVERFHLFTDPNYVPSCSINPVLSCGSVMVTDQAALFGFPNPLLGIAAFPVIIVTGVLAIARVSLPRWYWLGQSLGTLLGFVLVNWLAFQSLYRIHALCPYCMVVWVITPIILVLSIGRVAGTSRAGRETRSWLWVALPVWYAVVIVAIGVEFWDYWSTLI